MAIFRRVRCLSGPICGQHLTTLAQSWVYDRDNVGGWMAVTARYPECWRRCCDSHTTLSRLFRRSLYARLTLLMRLSVILEVKEGALRCHNIFFLIKSFACAWSCFVITRNHIHVLWCMLNHNKIFKTWLIFQSRHRRSKITFLPLVTSSVSFTG